MYRIGCLWSSSLPLSFLSFLPSDLLCSKSSVLKYNAWTFNYLLVFFLLHFDLKSCFLHWYSFCCFWQNFVWYERCTAPACSSLAVCLYVWFLCRHENKSVNAEWNVSILVPLWIVKVLEQYCVCDFVLKWDGGGGGSKYVQIDE